MGRRQLRSGRCRHAGTPPPPGGLRALKANRAGMLLLEVKDGANTRLRIIVAIGTFGQPATGHGTHEPSAAVRFTGKN